MTDCLRTRGVAELVQERDRTAALLNELEREIAEVERQEHDLSIEIAEAEERGAWALAAELRQQYLRSRGAGLRGRTPRFFLQTR